MGFFFSEAIKAAWATLYNSLIFSFSEFISQPRIITVLKACLITSPSRKPKKTGIICVMKLFLSGSIRYYLEQYKIFPLSESVKLKLWAMSQNPFYMIQAFVYISQNFLTFLHVATVMLCPKTTLVQMFLFYCNIFVHSIKCPNIVQT